MNKVIDIIKEIKNLSSHISRSLEIAWRDTDGEPNSVDNEKIIRDCITSWVQDILLEQYEELINNE